VRAFSITGCGVTDGKRFMNSKYYCANEGSFYMQQGRKLTGISSISKDNVKLQQIPLQAWTGPDWSQRLRLSDFKTVGI